MKAVDARARIGARLRLRSWRRVLTGCSLGGSHGVSYISQRKQLGSDVIIPSSQGGSRGCNTKHTRGKQIRYYTIEPGWEQGLQHQAHDRKADPLSYH